MQLNIYNIMYQIIHLRLIGSANSFRRTLISAHFSRIRWLGDIIIKITKTLPYIQSFGIMYTLTKIERIMYSSTMTHVI